MEEIKLEREISSLEKSFERAKTKRTNIEEYFDTKMAKLNNNLQEMEADLKKMIDKDHVEVSPILSPRILGVLEFFKSLVSWSYSNHGNGFGLKMMLN